MKTSNEKILSVMRFCEPMAFHTTFKIGGPADIWAQPEDADCLKEILGLCCQDNIRVLVVGNGSNLLVKDKGVNACVINLDTPGFKNIKIENDTVTVGSGFNLNKFLNTLADNNLSGLEFLVGIPATVGGALLMNAGTEKWISDCVQEVSVMDPKGATSILSRKDLVFRYRGSNLEKYIVLSAKLRLVRSEKSEIHDRMRDYLSEKIKRQELDKPSAGCVFKNPQGDSAGRLIDVSGLKGKNVGDAFVSTKHANFIINAGNASCDDVLKLMDTVRDIVKKDHEVELEPEIKVVG